MVRIVERIEQEIKTLEDTVTAIAQEFHQAYFQYLTAFGQAVRQQLVLASYHLCTQGYPERFLSISFSGKQELQKAIRQLARQAENQLLKLLKSSTDELEELSNETHETGELGQLEEKLKNQEVVETIKSDNSDSPVLNLPGSEIANLLLNKQEKKILLAEVRSPVDLAQWQEDLENGINQIIKTTSRRTNRALQQNGILPKKLPGQILEAAVKAESNGEAMPGPPNLLNLIIEAENIEDPDQMMGSTNFANGTIYIMAIHLRLSEIEFADPTVATWRSQIRNLSLKLHRIGREYQKKEKELAIAKAEAAWRATWFDE